MTRSDYAIQHARTHLTSTDFAAITGKGPRKENGELYTSAADVFCEKTMELTPSKSGAAADLGTLLEGPLCELIAMKFNIPYRRNVLKVSKSTPLIACRHDGLAVDNRCGIEAKTSGIEGKVIGDWGEPGTSEVPIWVLIQTQVQMFVSELPYVHVPTVIGNRGQVRFKVDRDDESIEWLVEFGCMWWGKHVVAGVRPDDQLPSFETMKRIVRIPNGVAKVGHEFVVAYEEAKHRISELEKVRDTAKQEIQAAMGENELGFFGDPESVFSWLLTKAGHRQFLGPRKPRDEWEAILGN